MSNTIGLVKLPQPIQFSQTIQPAKLPQTCDDLEMDETIVSMGTGAYIIRRGVPEFDGKLREATFTTAACDPVASVNGVPRDTRAIICYTYASTIGQIMSFGDSGTD